MGMPYEKKNVSIITVVIDAPQDIISTLSGKLGQIENVSIKTTYSRV
jgi:putative iron-only hydrogenase system regulator